MGIYVSIGPNYTHIYCLSQINISIPLSPHNKIVTKKYVFITSTYESGKPKVNSTYVSKVTKVTKGQQ